MDGTEDVSLSSHPTDPPRRGQPPGLGASTAASVKKPMQTHLTESEFLPPKMHNKRTADTYNKIAKRWAQKHQKGYWEAPIMEMISASNPNPIILDIGCGNASAYRYLKGMRYLGVDISEMMAALGKITTGKNNLAVGDAGILPIKDMSIDCILAIQSLHHLPKKDVASALQEIHRVSKPYAKGFITVTEGLEEGYYEGQFGEERYFAHYQEDEFASLLQASRINVIRSCRDEREAHGLEKKVRLTYHVRIKDDDGF